jgi:hypothetical protein
LTEGFNLIWAVDQGSGGHGLLQAASGRGAAGDRAKAAALGGGSPARRRKRAGVLQSRRGRHQDDGKRTASTTVASRGGEGGAAQRSVRRRGGGGPARPSQRSGAHGCVQLPRFKSSPPRESPAAAHYDREVAAERRNGGGALGLGGGSAPAPRRLGFRRRGRNRGGGGCSYRAEPLGGADAESGWPRVRPRLGRGCDQQRREVEADTRAPRVSDRERRRAVGLSWAGNEAGPLRTRTRGGAEGLRADFTGIGPRRKQGWEAGWLSSFFLISFLKQANKLEFKPGLNPNTQK